MERILVIQIRDEKRRHGVWGFQVTGGDRGMAGLESLARDYLAVIAFRRTYRNFVHYSVPARSACPYPVWPLFGVGGNARIVLGRAAHAILVLGRGLEPVP